MTVVDVDGLRFRYRAGDEWLLSDVSLQVDPGEVVLLMGPSGCGKSTLARCLNGLIPHSIPGELEGTVRVCGADVAATPQSELTTDVGLVFQNPDAQFVTSTVADEVAFGLENLCVPPDEIKRRIPEALAQVGLEGFEERRIDRLSGGEKQRLALACQLAVEPSLLVFDEPTASLDPAGRRSVFETIRAVAAENGRSVVVIEHRCDALLEIVDRVVVLSADGRITARGTPEAVFTTHADSLLSDGVWLPEITRFAHALREEGVWPASRRLPVTVGDAVDALSDHAPARPVPFGRTAATGAAADARDPPAIDIRDLHAAYDDRSAAGEVLSGVDLTVPRGSLVAVVGPNGAGKSTLAKHCVDVLSPPRGTVYVDGSDVTALSASELHARVGYVFQDPESQFVADSVRAELRHEIRTAGPDAAIERCVDRALDRFGLSHRADANPFTLSHGEKRRLSAATMLVGDRKTVIFDEPTAGQDRDGAESLLETMAALCDDGRTVLWLTHNMELVARYAHWVAVLVDASVRFEGPPSALFADEDLLSAARLSRPSLYELADLLEPAAPHWATVVADSYAGRTSARHDRDDEDARRSTEAR